MTRETAPPGETFEERWPDDAAEIAWMAAPWIPVVLGATAGVLGVPIVLSALAAAWAPLSIVILAVLFGGATLGLVRARGALQRWSGRAWRVVTWVILAVGLGILIGVLTTLVCAGEDCSMSVRVDPERPIATIVVFGSSFLGSIGLAIVVDRAARRLARMR
jgi:hypothetical protein